MSIDIDYHLVLDCLILYQNKVQISKKDIRAIYIYGSRLFGTATQASDYDILVVHDNFSTAGYLTSSLSLSATVGRDCERPQNHDLDNDVFYEKDATLHLKTPNNVELEIHITDTKLYMDLMRKHDGVVLFSVFMPDSFILYEEDVFKTYRQYWFAHLNISFRRVQWQLFREADVWCFQKAKKLWNTDLMKAKKNIIHGIRYLYFAQAIVSRFQNIPFDQMAKDQYYQIMEEDVSDWRSIEKQYKPIYEQLKEAVSRTIALQIEPVIDESTNDLHNNHSPIRVLRFINKYGLSSLSRLLNIKVCPVFCSGKTYDQSPLIKLQSDFTLVPAADRIEFWKSKVVQECNGLVLEQTTSGIYEIVCYPFNLEKELVSDNLYEYVKDSPSQYHILQRQPSNQETCSLFYYNSEWIVSYDKDDQEWESFVGTRVVDRIFHDTFWTTWKVKGYMLPQEHDHMTFVFRCLYTESRDLKIILYGCRNLETMALVGLDQLHEIAHMYRWDIAPTIPSNLTSISDIGVLIHNLNERQFTPSSDDMLDRVEALEIYDRTSSATYLISSTLHTQLKRLSVWDTCLLGRGKPFQSLQSKHNEECLIEIMRSISTIDANNNTDESIIGEVQPLFLPLYRNLKRRYHKLCDTLDTIFQSEKLFSLDNKTCVQVVTDLFQKHGNSRLPSNNIYSQLFSLKSQCLQIFFLLKREGIENCRILFSSSTKNTTRKYDDTSKCLIDTGVILQLVRAIKQ